MPTHILQQTHPHPYHLPAPPLHRSALDVEGLYDQWPGCFIAQPVWTSLPRIYISSWVFVSVWVDMNVCHVEDELLTSLIHLG